MTTALDIIDTSVKIGLGAIISGIATYFITHTGHRHAVSKDLIDEKRRLLIDTVRKIDSAGRLRNRAKLSISLQLRSGDNQCTKLDEELSLLWKAGDQLREAESNCYLIGDDDLAKLVTAYSLKISEYHNYIYLHGTTVDSKHTEVNDKCVELKSVILKQYFKSLARIYS